MNTLSPGAAVTNPSPCPDGRQVPQLPAGNLILFLLLVLCFSARDSDVKAEVLPAQTLGRWFSVQEPGTEPVLGGRVRVCQGISQLL